MRLFKLSVLIIVLVRILSSCGDPTEKIFVEYKDIERYKFHNNTDVTIVVTIDMSIPDILIKDKRYQEGCYSVIVKREEIAPGETRTFHYPVAPAKLDDILYEDILPGFFYYCQFIDFYGDDGRHVKFYNPRLDIVDDDNPENIFLKGNHEREEFYATIDGKQAENSIPIYHFYIENNLFD